MSEQQIVIHVGAVVAENESDLPALQPIVFNDSHEALAAAQQLLMGARAALANDNIANKKADIRLMLSGKAIITD